MKPRQLLIRRILAFLLDILIINIFIMSGFRGVLMNLVPLKGSLSFTAAYGQVSQDPGAALALSLLTILMGLFVLGYFALSEFVAKTTIGLYLFGLGIKTESGKELGLFRAAFRNLYCLPFFPFIILWIIDPVFLLVSGDRLTERLTKTKTVVI